LQFLALRFILKEALRNLRYFKVAHSKCAAF
jgi:hypothetical protein